MGSSRRREDVELEGQFLSVELQLQNRRVRSVHRVWKPVSVDSRATVPTYDCDHGNALCLLQPSANQLSACNC